LSGIDEPRKVHPALWKRLLDNPSVCGKSSKKYRALLPLEHKEVIDDSAEEVCGFYFKHDLKILRVLVMFSLGFASALGIAMYLTLTADAATGFTVGSFIISTAAMFLAVLAVTMGAQARR
jgi:hypothetical protein